MILHWFRRDLRLADNTAFQAAFRETGGQVIPVFILSAWKAPAGEGAASWCGAPRQAALCGSLRTLAAQLESLGGRLILRRGPADQELERLIRETGARAIFFNRDPDPFGRAMEERVAKMAARMGVQAVGSTDVTALPPEAVTTGSGQPFRVFTPFAKAWMRHEQPSPDSSVILSFPSTPVLATLSSDPLPSLSDWGLPTSAQILEPGEPAARRRMDRFFDGPIYRYGEERDIPAADATSHFSMDLRWGTLSIRELVHRCRRAVAMAETASQRGSALKFLNELIWREFYMAILWHWPEVLRHEFQPKYRGLPWLRPGERAWSGSNVSPAEAFRRWGEGTTGFPIVDAGMRQLAATGWMHNRVRMIVAMFLTKDLHLDWRLGERFFLQHLADGEIASNNGGWQWSAGTGADAAPYFRIQNPWTQTAKFDPDGLYIKTWVPELRDIPAAAFMRPPAPGQRLAQAYPSPIVDHGVEREVTLEMFRG